MSWSATVYLALGHLSMGVGGDTIAQARDHAAAYAEQHHALRPSAVCVYTRRLDRQHWFGWDGKRWRKGGWCFGCAAWRLRVERLTYCDCGDSLWNSPLDPGWAHPKFYWTQRRSR